MILEFQKKDKDSKEIEERLKELSLAYKTIDNQDSTEIILIDSSEKVIGKEAILEHLEKLSGELNQWYYCNC